MIVFFRSMGGVSVFAMLCLLFSGLVFGLDMLRYPDGGNVVYSGL